jgi:hypothetical protein
MNFNARSGFTLFVPLALLAAQAGAQTTYTFVTFTVPNSTYTDTVGITESGDVTGYYGLPASNDSAGFLRSAAGAIGTISYPGAQVSGAYGMNKFGVIAGNYANGSNLGGFFYRNGSYKNVVVNGQPAPLNDINDYGYYVGCYGTPGACTAFVASPNGQITLLQYPGEYYTSPYWVKNSGEVIGTYLDQVGHIHTFVWTTKAGYKTISVPGVPGATIGDINSSGVMVGGYFNGVTARGFVYQKGKFQIVLPPGADGSGISAINNKGQIAGSYTIRGGSGNMGFVATPTP